VSAPVSPPVSSVIPAGAGTAPRARRSGRLRRLGAAGLASAAVIAVATFAAIFGPLLAPYTPDLPNLSLPGSGRPAGICSATTSRAATCSPGCWPTRSPP